LKREAVINERFLDDLRFWTKTQARVALKILDLVEAILREPFSGLGDPEPLKYMGPNIWSRRITDADRLVYRVEHERVYFLQARWHYQR
jgi:toxin YoeB